ncbi:MAG: 50S ribosomal protein L24 [Candidatus Thermoplasmatota archaeon]|nr:50S ribosomal protein L24 [Candidatus Thermoplasmatota archaeon]
MHTRSKKPTKQRKAQANSPYHRRNKTLRAPLDPKRYANARVKRVTLRTGDTVKVLRGSRQGHEGKIAIVNLKKGKVSIEKALLRKADNKEVAVWFDPSNLMVMKMDLSDPLRKEKFKGLGDE